MDATQHAIEVGDAVERLRHVFHEDEPSPLMQPEEDDQIREDCLAVLDAHAAAVAERDALRRFKEYVHARLDAAGVPKDPDSPHKVEGCRIGGRLDFVLGKYAVTEQRALIDMLTRAGVGHGTRTDHNPPGESVQVECDDSDDARDWTVTEFGFDADGRLTEVVSYKGQEG